MLPLPSVTVQVTVVAPRGKEAGASLMTEATLQLSAVVALPRLTFARAVLQAAASAVTLTAAGALIVGAVVSNVTSTELLGSVAGEHVFASASAVTA